MKKIEIAIIVIVVIVCFFRFFTKVREDLFLVPWNDKKVSVEGLVIEEPEDRANGTRVLLRVSKISLASSTSFANNDSFVLSTVRTSLDLKYGDVVVISGTLEKPEVIVGEDGRSFDYPHYLGKSGIYYLLKGIDISRTSQHQGNRIKEFLLDVKKSFVDSINSALPEPHSLLASGLVVAGKGALSDDLQEQFKRVGLIHIVVLSGSNVTIIAEAIIKTLSFLPRFVGAVGGIFGIIAFTVIAGASATIVRSAVMSIIAVIGNVFGRQGDALRALIIAACGMSLLNPDIVLYDPSFQLSFTGTLGLILLGNITDKWFCWIPDWGGLRTIISASVASQISITPMILHMSGMYSFVSLVVNILVLPLLPLTMLVVFLTGCMSFIAQILSIPFSIVSYSLLQYELWIVDLFSGWNFAAVTIPTLTWLAVFEIYGAYVLIFIVYRIYKKSHPIKDETLVKQLQQLGKNSERG
ncbi:MAG: ComEC/Rec2 family competence protein [Patescibacteria group bacterium]